MDVYISEEYVMRRRMERKAAAGNGNGKSSKMVLSESGTRSEEREARPVPGQALRLEKNSGLSDIVFSCFSA
ncbi:hypothetical protein FF1_038052 [Malus domestica]